MMSTQQDAARDATQVTARGRARAAATGALVALRQLAGGLVTALGALGAGLVVVVTFAASLVGVGLYLVPGALRLVRAVADRERARLVAWGAPGYPPEPLPPHPLDAVRDPGVQRELRWLAWHALAGFPLGAIGVALPLAALQNLTIPLWWWLLPRGTVVNNVAVNDLGDAFAVALFGAGWILVGVWAAPWLARLQAAPGRRLLHHDEDLSVRVAQLTATRAAALDAHAAELRRIERSLHDGSQNRLVAVTVLLGAARRMVARDPAAADEILERAQGAAEQALAELRAVVRSILPPVLLDRGLAGALTGLAASCPVPCRIDVELTGRCAASVESTAYFVVAEALTNVSRHSRARHASVVARNVGARLRLTVTDDGTGGADERRGSGLGGIRGRVEAHDGTLTLTSPPGGPTILEVDLPCGL